MNNKNTCVEFKAVIESVRYYNPENNYHIMQFWTKDEVYGLKRVHGRYVGTLVGNCVKCIDGDTCIVTAEQVIHPQFGLQYKIISLSYDKPTTADDLYTFLSAIITESQATILYNAYPDICERVLEDNNYVPNLKILKGIGEKTWFRIREKIIDNLGYAELITLLAPVGCTLYMIKKIGNGTKDINLLKQKIIDNPYILCDFPNVGFKKVDGFALKINPDIKLSEQRILSCIKYILNNIGDSDGHSYVFKEDLKKQFKILIPEKEALEVFETVLEKFKNIDNTILFVDDERVAQQSYKHMEQYILSKCVLLQNTANVIDINYKTFLNSIAITSQKQGFILSDEQVEAVRSISNNNVIVISGKAGVGKTSVIKAILEVYKHCNIGMAALSAKAAKRMREVTGFENAQTIHRLLGWTRESFTYNENTPLPYDLLILDECSMNNIYLFYSILKAVKPETKIVMAGDFCQLAPIGVGNVFSDIVKNPIFSNHLLTQVYRQSEDSFINEHANIIREGIMPFDIEKAVMPFGKDVLYVFKNKPEDIVDTTVNLYLKFLENLSIEDITIVVPRKDTVTVSCKTINNLIQEYLLKNEWRELKNNDKVIKLGARIINKKNDYDKGVLNGELGTVIYIDDNKSFMTVLFDEGHKADFTVSDLAIIELGYAISVHSSQGSQYKVTIVAMDMSSYTLLTSNMIYTAMTRAQDKLVVVSQPSSFMKAVTNVQEHNRNTFLKDSLSNFDMDILLSEHSKNMYKTRPIINNDMVLNNFQEDNDVDEWLQPNEFDVF